jgi:hypothetical protein
MTVAVLIGGIGEVSTIAEISETKILQVIEALDAGHVDRVIHCHSTQRQAG